MEKSIFKDEIGIVFGMSQKDDGDMKVWPGEGNVGASANRRKFFAANGLDVDNAITALVVHGDKIFVAQDLRGYYVVDHDAIMTNMSGTILAITAADCPPIFFYDPVKRVVAMAHSGWRSTVLNIAEKTVAKMCSFYGSKVADIQAFIGPHIQVCHFAVGPDVAEKFASFHVEKRGVTLHVNLESVIYKQLLGTGLSAENIGTSDDCTFCKPEYFSFRRDKPERVQAGIAYLGLKA